MDPALHQTGPSAPTDRRRRGSGSRCGRDAASVKIRDRATIDLSRHARAVVPVIHSFLRRFCLKTGRPVNLLLIDGTPHCSLILLRVSSIRRRCARSASDGAGHKFIVSRTCLACRNGRYFRLLGTLARPDRRSIFHDVYVRVRPSLPSKSAKQGSFGPRYNAFPP